MNCQRVEKINCCGHNDEFLRILVIDLIDRKSALERHSLFPKFEIFENERIVDFIPQNL